MKISYAILTHNEGEYIENLLSFLINHKQSEDEIVVVDDYSTDELTKSILDKYSSHIKLEYREFDGDHTQKNYLNSLFINLLFLNNIYQKFFKKINEYNNNQYNTINKLYIINNNTNNIKSLNIKLNYYIIKKTIDEKIYKKQVKFIPRHNQYDNNINIQRSMLNNNINSSNVSILVYS